VYEGNEAGLKTKVIEDLEGFKELYERTTFGAGLTVNAQYEYKIGHDRRDFTLDDPTTWDLTESDPGEGGESEEEEDG